MIMAIAPNKTMHENEQGLASITITLIIMLIISLIIIGFVKLTRREQTQALDRQLSTEAFYAAESGINDAASAINGAPAFTANKPNCAPVAGLPSGSIDSTKNISYSCLIINQDPPTLKYGSVDTAQSTFVPIHGVDATGAHDQNITAILISWQSTSGNNLMPSLSPSAAFPTQSAWASASDTGVLRISLTPEANLDRTSLINNTYTAFLYPNNTGGALGTPTSPTPTLYLGGAPNLINQGQIVSGSCSTGNNSPTSPLFCNVKIDTSSIPQPTFLLRLKSIYQPNQVIITAFTGPGGATQVNLAGAQVLVDSTGKAQDVLRRIQVRLPANNTYNYPEFAIDSADSICKILQVAPPSYVNLSGSGATDDACNPAT